MSTDLDRVLAVTPRAAEYFSTKELQAQTGQPASNFASVVLKELIDNALDAAESAGVAPEIEITANHDGEHIFLTVSDNGPGLPAETLDRTLDFNVRASTNSHYRAPTRGLQGNALKTVFGIVHAMGGRHPVIIEAHGIRHSINVWLDPAGHVRIERAQEKGGVTTGTRITVAMPERADGLGVMYWARAFSTFNPHATVKINVFGFATKQR